MSAKTYTDPKSFWDEVSPHLRNEEAANGLLLGLSSYFQGSPNDCLYQGALFDGGQFLGAVQCSRYETKRNLVVSSVNDPDAAKQLFLEFRKSNIDANGLIGPVPAVIDYKKLFEMYDFEVKPFVEQGIYRCRKVKVPSMPENVNFRPANTRDVRELANWIEEFYKEAVPHDPTPDGTRLAEARIKKSMIYVLEGEGHLLSMAAWARDIGTSCAVNLVFTPQAHRGKGYASFVTAKVTELQLKAGKLETNLYTDMANPVSNKIYQDIGYEFVGDSIHFGIF